MPQNREKNKKKEELGDKKPVFQQKEMDSKHFTLFYFYIYVVAYASNIDYLKLLLSLFI